MIDDAIAERLAKLLGMLGSAHDGERAVAALKADQLIRSLGLTWFDIVAKPHVETCERRTRRERRPRWRSAVKRALNHLELLTEWEREFVANIARQGFVSDKQSVVLDEIVRKVRGGRKSA